MENILHFFRGLGGLIVLLVVGYIVGFALFTMKAEDVLHNLIWKLVLAFILLGIIVGIIGIIIELSNI